MANAKKKFPYDRDLLPENLSTLYDPSNAYGRKKVKDWYGTAAGRAHANADHDDYNAFILGEAGGFSGNNPFIGGGTDFEKFAGGYFDTLDAGYRAALGASGGHLNYADYMKTAGFGPSANQNALTTPRTTGNAFTSTSMPAAPTGFDRMRYDYLRLTPQQRAAQFGGGINPATSNRPGRWSIF